MVVEVVARVGVGEYCVAVVASRRRTHRGVGKDASWCNNVHDGGRLFYVLCFVC